MKHVTTFATAAVFFFAGAAYANKKAASTTNTTQDTSLAHRLGGYPAISKVVDEFVKNVGADKRINTFFAKTNLKDLKKKLSDQICEAAGGYYDAKKTKPCKYTGKDMMSAHKGMGVKGEHFDALVEDLVAALDKFKVPDTEKNELLSHLAPMRGAIVEETLTTN